MIKNKKIRKRYKFSVLGIIIAIISVLLLRFDDIDFERKKMMTTKELKAILELNKNFYDDKIINDETVKELREAVANRISYKKLFDEKVDFKNFDDFQDKNIYGFQLENRVHVGFYKNNETCVNYNNDTDYCIGIVVDTNGYTRPNKIGYDQYLLKVYKNIIKE